MTSKPSSPLLKPILASTGLLLLVWPVVWHASFEQRLNAAEAGEDIVEVLYGFFWRFCSGLLGVMILGMVSDGGSGYRSRWHHVVALPLAVGWLFCYPAGYIISIPLLINSTWKLLSRSQPGP